MTSKKDLIRAKYQLERLIELIGGNEYEQFMLLKLTSVYYELERQINNASKDSNS